MDRAELVCDLRLFTLKQTKVFTRTGHWSCTDLNLQCRAIHWSELTVIVHWQSAEQHQVFCLIPAGRVYIDWQKKLLLLNSNIILCVHCQSDSTMQFGLCTGSKGHITREQRHLTTSLPLVWAQQTVWWCSGRHKQETQRWTKVQGEGDWWRTRPAGDTVVENGHEQHVPTARALTWQVS